MGGTRVSAAEYREYLANVGIDLFDGRTAGCADCGQDLNLNAIAIGLGLENVEYEPEEFEALVYHSEDHRTTFTIFGDGTFVTVDAPDRETTKDAIADTYDALEELGLLERAPGSETIDVPVDAFSIPIEVPDRATTSETESAETESSDPTTTSEAIACGECGTELSGDENFCPECGTELDSGCPDCGYDLSGDENFCPECGTEVAS